MKVLWKVLSAFLKVTFGHSVHQSLSHPVTLSLCHSVIWSLCHSVTQSLGHFVIWSLGHSITHISAVYAQVTSRQRSDWCDWRDQWSNDWVTEWPSDRVTEWPEVTWSDRDINGHIAVKEIQRIKGKNTTFLAFLHPDWFISYICIFLFRSVSWKFTNIIGN